MHVERRSRCTSSSDSDSENRRNTVQVTTALGEQVSSQIQFAQVWQQIAKTRIPKANFTMIN